MDDTTSGNNDNNDFDRVVTRVVRWVEGRLRDGQAANPNWDSNIESWSAQDPDGDHEAPPILLGELMTRLTDPTYGGFPPGAFGLRKPGNLSQGISSGQVIRFEWEASSNVYYYEFELSLDPQFIQPPVHKSDEIAHLLDLPANTLEPKKQYFWRVIAKNSKGKAAGTGNPFSFVTNS